MVVQVKRLANYLERERVVEFLQSILSMTAKFLLELTLKLRTKRHFCQEETVKRWFFVQPYAKQALRVPKTGYEIQFRVTFNPTTRN
jgi:hypothetical protein